jgi:uncharacterized protein YjiS (DUF1127 family)
MTRSIEQIKREIESLEDIVNNIALELQVAYRGYLKILTEALSKQLIIATYQLCTQIYPHAFLKLSFNQRQKLQQNLRKIGQEIGTNLLAIAEESIEPVPVVSKTKNLIEQMLESLSLAGDGEQAGFLEISEEAKAFFLKDEPEAKEDDEDQSEDHGENQENHPESDHDSSFYKTPDSIRNPEDLVQWYKQIEKKIDRGIETLSRKSNHQLKDTGILPSKLPNKFLDMAIQASESSEAMTGPPNLLNLLIEIESGDSSEKANVNQITVICLRLSEIEFSDPVLSNQRHQIRNILSKLVKLQRQYQHKQKEMAIAEAEAAWRASWYE